MKTYSSKATAKRGAIRELSKTLGLSQDEVKAQFDSLAILASNEDGAWAWLQVQEDVANISFNLTDDGGQEMPAGTYNAQVSKVTEDATGITIEMELPDTEAKAHTKKIECVHKSDILNPCKLVWDMADEMKGQRRKDIIAACVEKGVAYNTARTQYQLWFTATKNSQPA